VGAVYEACPQFYKNKASYLFLKQLAMEICSLHKKVFPERKVKIHYATKKTQ